MVAEGREQVPFCDTQVTDYAGANLSGELDAHGNLLQRPCPVLIAISARSASLFRTFGSTP